MSSFITYIVISKKIQQFMSIIFKTLQRITETKKDLLSSEAFTPQIFSDSFCSKTRFYISSLYVLLLNVQNSMQKESAFLNTQIPKNKGNTDCADIY